MIYQRKVVIRHLRRQRWVEIKSELKNIILNSKSIRGALKCIRAELKAYQIIIKEYQSQLREADQKFKEKLIQIVGTKLQRTPTGRTASLQHNIRYLL